MWYPITVRLLPPLLNHIKITVGHRGKDWRASSTNTRTESFSLSTGSRSGVSSTESMDLRDYTGPRDVGDSPGRPPVRWSWAFKALPQKTVETAKKATEMFLLSGELHWPTVPESSTRVHTWLYEICHSNKKYLFWILLHSIWLGDSLPLTPFLHPPLFFKNKCHMSLLFSKLS